MKQRTTSLIFLFLTCLPLLAQHTEITYPEAKTMTDTVWQLDGVEIRANKQRKIITGTLSGKLELQMNELKNLPRFLGDTDPLRTLQLMPGVQTAGEINSGIYIRGGDPGHNQVLLNGAPIYNPMHLLGFFSVFNTNHFNKSTLLKSYIPPHFGGRLSGVISMQTHDTAARKITLSGNIGILASQATASIPISKKISLYASARLTYINPIARLIQRNEDQVKLGYNFQDYNLTFLYQPAPENKITVNGYYGSDVLNLKEGKYQSNGGIHWQNIASSIQWKRSFGDWKELEQTLFFSSYENQIKLTQNEIQIKFPSDIKDIGYKGSFNFDFLKSQWKAGGEYTYHLTDPQYPLIEKMYGTGIDAQRPDLFRTQEFGLFINCHTNFKYGFSTDIGLRYSGLVHCGEYNEKRYDILGNITSSTKYAKGERVCYYGGFEPRISVEYAFNANKKCMLSYGLHRQYMSQVAVSGIGFPTDFWIPVSKNIPPQRAHAFAAGYFQSIFNDVYEFSAEVYYKRMTNLTEFNGELFDMINQSYDIEERILYGTGQNYGAEIMLKKNSGKLTGWVSYTLGWSKRRFPEINHGKEFPSKHDRRHDLSIVSNYKLNKSWDFSAVFVYATGNAFTMPVALYMVGENALSQYGPHNGARMPAYHRLDLSVNYWFVKNSCKESGLNFSVYNTYARENPIYLDVKVKTDKDNKTLIIRKKGKSLYGLLPSISYSFKF